MKKMFFNILLCMSSGVFAAASPKLNSCVLYNSTSAAMQKPTPQNAATMRLSAKRQQVLEKNISNKLFVYIAPTITDIEKDSDAKIFGDMMSRMPGYKDFLASFTDEEFQIGLKKIETMIHADHAKEIKFITSMQRLSAELGVEFMQEFVGGKSLESLLPDFVVKCSNLCLDAMIEFDTDGIILAQEQEIKGGILGFKAHVLKALIRTDDDRALLCKKEEEMRQVFAMTNSSISDMQKRIQEEVAFDLKANAYLSPERLSSCLADTRNKVLSDLSARVTEDRGKALQFRFDEISKKEEKLRARKQAFQAREAAMQAEIAAMQARIAELEKKD